MPFAGPDPSGSPTFPFALFRGQVIDVQADRDRAWLNLTLKLEDFNRLFGLSAVGAPTGPPDGFAIANPATGTQTWVDPRALVASASAARYQLLIEECWPGSNDGTFDDVHDLTTGEATVDAQTATTTLGALLDEIAAALGGLYPAYWRDADAVHHWTRLAPMGEVSEFAIPAPYAISTDATDWDDLTIQGNIKAGVSWRDRRRRAYIRGGTSDGSRFVDNVDAAARAGDGYVDAPGSLTVADANSIGDWHLAKSFAATRRGTAVVEGQYHGWRVGQTGYFTDAELARYTGLADLAAIPAIIQQIEAELIAPSPGMLISFVTVDNLSMLKVEWKALKWNERLGGVGDATVSIVVWDPDETFSVEELQEVIIWADAEAAIRYTMTFGDVRPGTLNAQRARQPLPAQADPRQGPPVIDFMFLHYDPLIAEGQDSVVIAQAVGADKKPLRRANIPHVWGLEQRDDDLPIEDGDDLGGSYSIDPAPGTLMLTDTNGQTAVTFSRGAGTSRSFRFKIHAVELVPGS